MAFGSPPDPLAFTLSFLGAWAMIAGVQQIIRHGSFAASFLLLALAVSAAAANTPTSSSVIHTRWNIEALAMSGSRIAYDVSAAYVFPSPKGCKNKVLVRSLRTGTTQRVSGESTCFADGSSTGDGVRELAFVGRQFAWIVNQGGNTQWYDYLRTASLPMPRDRKLAGAARFGDFDVQAGNWIGQLVGSGNLIAVNRWSTNGQGGVKHSELDLLGATGLRRVVLGPKAIFAQSADAGRIAVLRADGTIGIYDAGGKLRLEVAPKPAKEVALRGNDLLVLTKTRTLEIYDSRSGALLRSWPVPRGAATLDAYAGLAAYADHPVYSGQRFRVHVLQLTTGKDVVVGTGTYAGRPRRDVQLEAPGLVYAKNFRTLVFIPRGRLLAART
jgi:hypothetical protein